MARRRTKPPPPPGDGDPTPSPPEQPLTGLETQFLSEYLIDENHIRAYLVVCPHVSYRTARDRGSRMIRRPHVLAEYRAMRDAQYRRNRVKADLVVQEIVNSAFPDPGAYFDQNGHALPMRAVPYAARRLLSGFDVVRERTRTRRRGATTTTVEERVVRYKLVSKLEALGMLARHLGLNAALPNLDLLLGALPPELAARVKAALQNPPGRNGSPAHT